MFKFVWHDSRRSFLVEVVELLKEGLPSSRRERSLTGQGRRFAGHVFPGLVKIQTLKGMVSVEILK